MTKTPQNITVILLERKDRVGGACVSETVERQSFFDWQYADDAHRRFYQFGEFENVSICGSSTYPCGSVAGTPGYMCVSELLRRK